MTIAQEQYFLFVVLVQALDIESSRTFIVAIYRVIFKLAFILVVNIIYMIFTFIYFSTHEPNKDTELA